MNLLRSEWLKLWHDADHLGDARHRPARRGALRRPLRRPGLARRDSATIDEIADRHRPADGDAARPRGADRSPPSSATAPPARPSSPRRGATRCCSRSSARRCSSALLAGLAYVVVNGGLALPLFAGRGGGPAADRRPRLEVYAGVVVSFALLCAFGLGVGAIVRNQVGAIIAAIAFFFVLSPLPELLPGTIGDYFPAQAIGSLHGHPEGDGSLGQVARRPRPRRLGRSACSPLGTLLVCHRDLDD